MKVCAKRGGRGALFAARKKSGRKAASNGSWRSLSFVRFLRSRFETIIFYSACLPSAAITGCVQDASYACKKRTPHSRHFRFDSPPFPIALQAAKSLPALGDGVSGRDERQSRLGAYRKCKARSRTAPPAGRIAFRCGDFGRTCPRRHSSDCRAGQWTPKSPI